MFDWDGMRKSRDESAAMARRAAPGLPHEHLVPGLLITMSPCKCTGDRSFSHDIWEIKSSNEGHIYVTKYRGAGGPFDGPHLVCKHEHEFYGAEHLLPKELEFAVSDASPERGAE
jgi:hypothetical protein